MRSKVLYRIIKNTPKDVEIFVDLYADLVVRINEILRVKQLSKKDLALRLDKKPSEISKWLCGEHNFTLRSLAKLSAELGEPLLEVPKKNLSSTLHEGDFIVKTRTIVTYTRLEKKPPCKVWQMAEEREPNNEISYAG